MKAILTYHSIDASGSPISVDSSVFRAHVNWLATGSCRVVKLEDLAAFSDGESAVALTFDDGFQNFADVAWPMLRDHGFPVTVFVVTEHVGRDNNWKAAKAASVPVMPLLSWDALTRLRSEGVTLGSHTRTHPNLKTAPPESLHDEIAGAAERVEKMVGERPRTFAYPYGELTRQVVDVVRSQYSQACTTELRPVRAGDDPVMLPRLDAYYFRRAGLLQTWGSASFRRYVWLRAHGRVVRRALEMTGAL